MLLTRVVIVLFLNRNVFKIMDKALAFGSVLMLP